MSTRQKLTVFYDAGCKVCAWEMESYIKQDIRQQIELVDISQPGFEASLYGLDPERVRFVLHAIDSEGTTLTGVDVFIEIWRRLDRPAFRLLVKAAEKSPVVRFLFDVGYQGFIRIRPYLPRRKCEGNVCFRRPAA